jgi:hypothetical protein
VERKVKHESQSNWKQLGSLANGVLRTIEEKRQKQAEFLAADNTALQSPPAERRIQLDLPLFHNDGPLAAFSTGRYPG